MLGNSFSNKASTAFGFAGVMPDVAGHCVIPLPLVAALREPVPHGAAWQR